MPAPVFDLDVVAAVAQSSGWSLYEAQAHLEALIPGAAEEEGE